MKRTIMTLCAIVFAGTANASYVYQWEELAMGSNLPLEASTNVVLHVDFQRLMAFSLSVEAMNITSNEVIVAIGCDVNEDGDLSLEEAAFALCYDCGERRFVNYRTQEVLSLSGDTIVFKRKNFDPAWNLAKVVKRGRGDVGEIITETVDNLMFSINLR